MITKMIKKYLLFALIIFSYACNNNDILDKNEKEWLKDHPNLIVGISPNAPPYQFVNDKGEISGIFIDFLSIIEKRTDYKFKKVYQSDFSKLLSDTKEGNVDILLEVQKTEERQHYLNFTPALLSHPHVIVVRSSQQGISSIVDLKDKNIAVVNKYAIQEYLAKNYPLIRLTPLTDDVTCLRAVATGYTDAFICQQAVATYYIEKEGISNLKIAGEINYKNELSIASRKDLDTLNIILTKAVNSISKNEKQKIYNNWLIYEDRPFYFEAKFWIILVMAILLVLTLTIAFNVTLRKIVKQKTSELIVAKEKAEESDRLKSAFLANMSHEIRTPMNGILGFAELLKEPALPAEQQQEYVHIIEKSGTRLLNIINNILDISKIESGQMKVFLSESNINEQIEYIFTFLKPEIEKKGLQFFYKNALPPNEAIIKTDREKIYAILTNLVKNAVKYTNEGSIEFGYEKKEKDLEFYIKDTGIGVAENRQDAIFERFIQADISDKHAFQGAGLGLSIAKAYVEMLGGKIWLESNHERKGSTFYFTIPYNVGPIMEEMEIKKIPSLEKNGNLIKDLKILIVEDEETSDLLIKMALKKISHTILDAKNGVEAIDVCRNNPDIDLILMDIKMPEMNGYEATREIRQFNKDVIIIAQTAYSFIGDKKKAIEAGCNDHISKPINIDIFLALIQTYFRYK
jgi:signal transduction histidine kinase